MAFPLLLSSAVGAAQLLPLSPLIALRGGSVASSVSLERSPARTALSPIASLLEQLSILTVRDHVAVIVSVLVLVALTGLLWHTSDGRSTGRTLRGLRWTGVALGTIATVYLAGALLPWPMARLRHGDPDEVAVDFHSHTSRSHDGRWDFSLARNRAWHRDGGFDVAYVTDHTDSASVPSIPPPDGERPVMLLGSEFRSGSAHLVRLGSPTDTTSVLLLTTPYPEAAVSKLRTAGTVIAGVEAFDASPRGLQWRQDHQPLLRQTIDSLHATPIASSNLHGWGRTVGAWTLLRLPGWQEDTPDVLDRRIRAALRRPLPGASRTVIRRPFTIGARALLVPVAFPMLLWVTMRTLDGHEAVVWLLWVWMPALVLLPSAVSSRRRALRAAFGAPFAPLPTASSAASTGNVEAA